MWTEAALAVTPDLSVFAVIALLLLCTVLLNVLIFKPIQHVVAEREQAVRGARELAESAAQKASAASADYDIAFGKARTELYREMDDRRRVALDKRAAILAETRVAVDGEMQSARTTVVEQSAAAREALDREAEALAGAIVERVLAGRQAAL